MQLSKRLGCPAPIPIVEKLFVRTIALDLTYLQILKANLTSSNSFFVGLFVVTILKFFLSYIKLSWSCIKKDPSNDLIEVRKIMETNE